MRVAIIGAGIAGLACARRLTDAGVEVRVFDKGRGVGGRASTRRADGLTFDHGAQSFAVRDDRFRDQVDRWVGDGVAAPWEARIVTLKDGRIIEESDEPHRYVGVPGMNAIAKDLARDLDVVVGTRVESLPRDEFDVVISAAPPAQTADLFESLTPLAERIRAIPMNPCWVVMAHLPGLDLPFDGAIVEGSSLGWIADNGSKPGRESECWILHGTPEWSRDHLEEDREEIIESLLPAFWGATGVREREPGYVIAHRWRYALAPEPIGKGCLLDPESRLGACGDWCVSADIEGAYLSGMAMADRILR